MSCQHTAVRKYILIHLVTGTMYFLRSACPAACPGEILFSMGKILKNMGVNPQKCHGGAILKESKNVGKSSKMWGDPRILKKKEEGITFLRIYPHFLRILPNDNIAM